MNSLDDIEENFKERDDLNNKIKLDNNHNEKKKKWSQASRVLKMLSKRPDNKPSLIE
jgi:hypothetical protein